MLVILIKSMKLDKTLGNLRKSRVGFFNITDYFVNHDLLKNRLNYKVINYGSFIYLKERFFTFVGGSYNFYHISGHFHYFFINELDLIQMFTARQMYVGDLEILKNKYNYEE